MIRRGDDRQPRSGSPSLEPPCPLWWSDSGCGQDDGVIHEHAVLDVTSGQELAFERAFEEAKTIIAGSPGFRSLRLCRCLERPSRYLLLVDWDAVEDHTIGFRGSPAYDDWRRLLHHFYDPFPTVEHYEDVVAL